MDAVRTVLDQFVERQLKKIGTVEAWQKPVPSRCFSQSIKRRGLTYR